VKQIHTTIDEYLYTSDDTVVEGTIQEGKAYTESEMNRIIQIREREEYRVKLFLGMMEQNQKSIVFCATQLHALAVRDLINQHSDSTNANYCQRVTADEGGLGEQHLRDFQDNEKSIPTILTTSQKLSTGVDAPELRNIILMRPVNSMISFKQIIGRGTRLFDGKDYFTLYDFVGAHKHFLDPEWDGEPLEPEPCDKCGQNPCVCEPSVCKICGERPCICEKPGNERCKICGKAPCECEKKPKPKMVVVKLSDGKIRELDSMIQTSFYSPDGKPISSQEFLESLFSSLPEFFKNEDELRAIWSKPDTRKKLLQRLEDNGHPITQLEDLASVIHAEDSDLFDVLAYVAYSTKPIKRSQRAKYVESHFSQYESKQRVFLDFVLKQYIESGVGELDDDKLPELLNLKYQAIADAKHELGEISSIRETFIGFQEYLYSEDS
jgi:type I restriction enzyme, R subunit